MVANAGRDLCEDTRYHSRQEEGWSSVSTKDISSLSGTRSGTSEPALSCATKGLASPGERSWQGQKLEHVGDTQSHPTGSVQASARGEITWDLTMELGGGCSC